jgi:DNA-binding GntR family transcriptional regulator
VCHDRPVRVSDRAYQLLRDDIVSWRLLPGTPLSEIELALRLGVSRTPLRSALTRLALEGLVDTSRGRTGVVPDVSARSVAELFELREALETHAARLAARRRDPAVFAALAAALLSALAGGRTHLVRARRVAAANPARLLRAADEHRLICEAIRDGDESLAAAATTVHLRVSSSEIRSVLEARAHQEGVS